MNDTPTCFTLWIGLVVGFSLSFCFRYDQNRSLFVADRPRGHNHAANNATSTTTAATARALATADGRNATTHSANNTYNTVNIFLPVHDPIPVIPPPPKYQFEIFVFTFHRLNGLQRLWKSLATANYLGRHVDLTVFFDFNQVAANNNNTFGPLDEWLMHAPWPHGRLRIQKRELNVGLRRNILEAWYPTGDNTFAAFFEDDLEVSSDWFVWVDDAIQKYYYSTYYNGRRMNKLIGLSLYRPTYDELTDRTVALKNGFQPFLFQQPSSWGAVYFPRAWQYFREYVRQYRVGEEPKVEGVTLRSNNWPKASSWKKFLIKMMYDKGMFMVYPNLPNELVLCTNHFMKGVHNLNPNLKRLPVLTKEERERYRLKGLDVLNLPPLNRLQVFDVAFNRVLSVYRLPNADKPLPRIFFPSQPEAESEPFPNRAASEN